jgi:hypothetical protein
MRRALDKYLAQWAEAEAGVAENVDGAWKSVVVVPACDELPECLDGLRPATGHDAALAIVVVNGRDQHPGRVHRANEALLCALRGDAQEVGDGIFLRRGPLDVLAIDRASPGRRLPPEHGVGLSRKIGCDVALALFARIRSRWIHSTDADATVPPDYFELDVGSEAVAVTRAFRHIGPRDELTDATLRYEIRLRYYVLALSWSGSPHAFHTIGSCISVDREAYAAVRGFPRRQAGEDFYLLNKVTKLGPIGRNVGSPVEIRARPSSRVPFGTGPAVARLLEDRDGPLLYDPRSFATLRAWHRVVAALAAGAGWVEAPLADLDTESRSKLLESLEDLGARVALEDLASRHHGESLYRHVWAWFDGFRTLKLVHALREAGHVDRPWRAVLDEAEFTPDAGDDPVAVVCDRLAAAEGEPVHGNEQTPTC